MVKAYYKKAYVMQLNQDQAHNLVTRGGAVWVNSEGNLRLQLPWKKFHRAMYEGTNPPQVEGSDGKMRPGHWEEEVKYMVDEEPPAALSLKEIKVFLKEGVRIWAQPLPAAYASIPDFRTMPDFKAEKYLNTEASEGASVSDYDRYQNLKELARASNEMMTEHARRSGGEQSEVRVGNKQVFSLVGRHVWLYDTPYTWRRSKVARKPLVPPPQNDSETTNSDLFPEITNPEETLAGPLGEVDPKIHAEDVPE